MRLHSVHKLIDEFPRDAMLSWTTIVFISSLLLIENGLALLPPWLLGSLADYLVGQDTQATSGYMNILLLWLFVIICQNALSYYNQLQITEKSEKIIYRLRTRLYDHLQSLPLSYFVTHQRGQLLSLLSHDTGVIASFATVTITGFIPYLLTALGALCCLFVMNKIIAISCILLLPFLVLSVKLLGRPINKLSKELMQVHGTTLAIAEENFTSIGTIKAYGGEHYESLRFTKGSKRLFQAGRSFQAAQARMAPMIRSVGSIIMILILLIAGKYLSSVTLTPGKLVTIVLYGMFLIRPLSSLATLYGHTQRALAAAARINELYKLQPEPLFDGVDLVSVEGAVNIEGVTFAYREGQQLLNNLNLTISPRETIAITGENGAGKSTLAHLLLRLYEPQAGRITLDGKDIRNISLQSLRSHFAIVQQTVLLRNGTIRENLLIAKPSANEEELLTACKRAQALEFITKLPKQLDTSIGDQGMKLSGGQQQRIALARAFLKNPAILILDEATAMFDPDSENRFITANTDLLQEYTVIIITHRPASLDLADRVYRLENGLLHQVF